MKETLVITMLSAVLFSIGAHAMGGDSKPISLSGVDAQKLSRLMHEAGFELNARGQYFREVISCWKIQPGEQGYTGNAKKDTQCEILENGN